jgi:hypothetical protein
VNLHYSRRPLYFHRQSSAHVQQRRRSAPRIPLRIISLEIGSEGTVYRRDFKAVQPEAWALIRYIHIKDNQEKASRLSQYAERLAQRSARLQPSPAALRRFKTIAIGTESHVRQGIFSYFKMTATTKVKK